jgi:hypothetical protein
MDSRAERLADPAFFPNCYTWQDLVFATLPVSVERAHSVLLDKAQNRLFCSCPLQPKPCVHAQAFDLLIKQAAPDTFSPAAQLPDWVNALKNGQAFSFPVAEPNAEHQKINQQKQRHLERLERAARGFQDLELWLLDTLRRGLATAISEDPEFYQSIAGRLADASMRGLSRNVRLLETIPVDQPDWADQTLAVLADAALALQAFRSKEQLPTALVNDLETFIGIAQKKETVLAEGKRLTDRWAVVGALEEQVEAQLRLRRTWLLGAKTGRLALLLEYAHGSPGGFLPGFEPGIILEGELVFYPSAWPQRALAPEPLRTSANTVKKLPGYETLEAMATAYATALGKQPWLAQFPVCLNTVTVYRQQGQFRLADTAGKSIALLGTDAAGWPLLALGTGRPLTVFGEWTGDGLLVLSALAEQRFVRLSGVF